MFMDFLWFGMLPLVCQQQKSWKEGEYDTWDYMGISSSLIQLQCSYKKITNANKN